MRLLWLALAAPLALAEDASYFPLAQGNRWEYRDDRGATFVMEVTGAEGIGGQTWFRITESRSDSKQTRNYQLRLDRQGRVWEWRGLIAPALRFSFGVDDGIFFNVEESCAQLALNTREGSDLVVRYVNTCSDGGLLWKRFRKGVGLVEWSSQSIIGPVTFRLVNSRLGG
jgi:hypothetical protein